MKTIKLKYFQNLLFLLPLLALQACMPDSLTKFKQEAPKKDPPPVIKPGVIVGDDGTEVPTAEIAPTTKFYYGNNELTIYERILVIDEPAGKISSRFDGSMGDEYFRPALLVLCEVVSSTDGLNRLPSGVVFQGGDSRSSSRDCDIVGTPTAPASYLNTATNVYEPVTYTIRARFRNKNNAIQEETTSIKLAAVYRPVSFEYSQTSRLILDLANARNFPNFSLSDFIATPLRGTGRIVSRDSQNKRLVVDKTSTQKLRVNESIDNASSFYNTEASISSVQNVVIVNERLETPYTTFPASCPVAPGPTSKIYIDSSGLDTQPANLITYAVTPDLPSTVKLCNFVDTRTSGDACFCRLPGEVVGRFTTVTSTTNYVFSATVTGLLGNRSATHSYNLIVSESPEAFNIAQRQLLQVANRVDFEEGETVSELITPPLTEATTAKGRVLRSFTLDADADGTDEEYIEVELLRGRFKKDSSIDNSRFYYAQNTIVLDDPKDFNISLKLNNYNNPIGHWNEELSFNPALDCDDAGDIGKDWLVTKTGIYDNETADDTSDDIRLNAYDKLVCDGTKLVKQSQSYVTGFLHDSSQKQGIWNGAFNPALDCDAMNDAGKYWEANAAGVYGGESVAILDKLVCNGEQIIIEKRNTFTKGIVRFIDTVGRYAYISTTYESYDDFKHPNVTSPFEQYHQMYFGLNLGGWNPTQAYYLGTINASVSSNLPLAASCTASNLRKYYYVTTAGNGYAIGDKIQCVTAGSNWVKKSPTEIFDTPESTAACSPTEKVYKISHNIQANSTGAAPANISTLAQLSNLTGQCDATKHGDYHNITTNISGIGAGVIDGITALTTNDIVICGFENKWIRLDAQSPLRSFIKTKASGTLNVGDVAYCNSDNSEWSYLSSSQHSYHHYTVEELSSKSLVIRMASDSQNYFGRDLTSPVASGYIVHTRSTDTSIANNRFLRVKDVKGIFNITNQAVAHSEYRSQNDAIYDSAAVSFQNPHTLTNIDRVFDDNTYYLERGEFVVLQPSTAKGGEVSYEINPALPTGLVFNTRTGEISGTPSTAASLREYTINIRNAIGSITYKFKLEVIDYFKIKEVNRSIFTAYLHKSGQNQHYRDCRVNSRDIVSPYRDGGGVQDVTPVDISCYLDIGENDLNLYGLKLAYSVGGGVCSFVTYEPMAYWAETPFTTTTGTTRASDRIDVTMNGGCTAPSYKVPGTNIDASTIVGQRAKTSAEICNADYTDNVTNGRNCDDGEYDAYYITYSQVEGSATCAVAVNKQTVKCGGKKSACLRGPIRDTLSDELIDGKFVGRFQSSSEGLDITGQPYNVSIAKPITNANFLLKNSCEVSDYLYQHGRWGKTYDRTTSSVNKGRAPKDSVATVRIDEVSASLANIGAAPVCNAAALGDAVTVNADDTATQDDDIYVCVADNSALPGTISAPGAVTYKYIGPFKRWEVARKVGPISAFWSWPGTDFNKSTPYYTFTCEDSAREIKARIRLAVRDWDLEITPRDIGGGVRPLALIDRVDPPNDVMDNPNMDPFDISLNNYPDFDDQATTAPSCGSEDPVPLTGF